MADTSTGSRKPVLARGAQAVGIAIGALVLAAGSVAVFLTDNEVGAAALVTVGAAIAALSTFANRIGAFEAAGLRFELAQQASEVREEAEQARASGDVVRAQQLERQAQDLLIAASAVGSRYEQIRTTQPSGWERTSRLEEVLREARALDTDVLRAADVAGIFASGAPGDRVAALALIERNPRLVTADVLVDAIVHSQSSFEQYHALVAAESALDHLSTTERERLREAVVSVLSGSLGDRSSDRRTVARRLLERMTPAGG
jgi:hypothetical protein